LYLKKYDNLIVKIVQKYLLITMDYKKISEVLITVVITSVVTHLFSEKQAAEEYRELAESKREIKAETEALNNARENLYQMFDEIISSTKDYEEAVHDEISKVAVIVKESNEFDSKILTEIDSKITDATDRQLDSIRSVLKIESQIHED
tara:strand:+ start:414 stop:860 length:447 start_codon:yes stop_codon:yes gene_type:complete